MLVTSAWFEPGFRGGGPIRSLARIVDTAAGDIDVVLVTTDRDLGDTEPYAGVEETTTRGRVTVYYLDTRSVSAWWRLVRRLRAQRFDLLYVNSLLNIRFSIAPVLAVFARLISAERVLIAPRGELSPGALSLKAGKKRLFLRAAGLLLRSRRIEWHASTAQEAAQIAIVFPGSEIVVVAVQTALPLQAERPVDAHGGPIALVFLSRISAKKNLDLVLHALGRVSQPASLDIYGPIEDRSYWDSCLAVMAGLPAHTTVAYRGEVLPTYVQSTFGQHDVFVFPTLGENFGHVIAESLAASCPVICSVATPWTSVLESGAGCVLPDLDVGGLARELDRLAAMAPAERHAMRLRAADAYDAWRETAVEENVIEVWRTRRRLEERPVNASVG